MIGVVRMMLWEAWRLTRLSLLMRVVIVSLTAIFLVYLSRQRVDGNGQNMVLVAVFSLISLQTVISSLYAKFGEERPGFPFYLGYSRPVPTWLLVLVPLGYFALSMAAMYFIPVLLLVLAFDAQLPLMTGTFLISLIAVICAVCNWWSVDKLQRGAAWLVAYLAINHVVIQKVFSLYGDGAAFNTLMTSSLLDYPGLVATALLAAGVAVYGVEQQRHGDAVNLSSLAVPRSLPAIKGLLRGGEFLTSLEWLQGLYILRCPTRSPVAAEVWREMKTRGVPVIVAGILVSIIVPVLWYSLNAATVAGHFPKAPPGTPPAQLPLLFTLTIVPLSLPLFIATANLFGISRRQGRVELSKFDATLPITTFHQIALRLFIAISSLLIALLITSITLWQSTPLFIDIYDYRSSKAAIAAALDAMTGFEMIQYGYVYLMQFITVTVFFGILQLLWVLYARRILYGVMLFLVYFVFLAVGRRYEWFSLPFAINQLWLIIDAVAVSTAYVFYDNLRKHMLNPGQAAVIFVIWLLYVPAYFQIMMNDGVWQSGVPAVFIGWLAMISMLPLAACVMAPWTVGKFRTR